MHVVVIGNGIVALTSAFRLLQRSGPDLRVTVIGDGQRAGSATLAAGAMLNSFAEVEYDTFKSDIDTYRFELSHLATQMWPKFEMELIDAAGDGLPSGCKSCQAFCGGGCAKKGTYVVNNTSVDELEDDNFDAIVRALDDFNEPHRLMSPRDIPNYNPQSRNRATRAVFIDNEGWFNPRLMIEKLDAIMRRSARVHQVDDTVVRIEHAGQQVTAVHTRGGQRIEADRFLLATGASVSALVKASELPLQMQRVFYGVGVSLQLGIREMRQSHCIRTPARGLACGLYSVPYFESPGALNSQILVGASNFISKDPYPYGRITSVENLMRAVTQEINQDYYKSDLVRVNVGWRPTSQDTYPMVGPTSMSNLVIATGTKRDGFHMAPVLSQQIAAMLLGDAVDERFSVFAPERPLLKTMTREQAVDKAVRHQINAAYQHGFVPATSRTVAQLRQSIEADVHKVHDQAGAVDWGIPPEMLDMYRWGHAQDGRA
ncbi:FAD-binding oxidoreductase [uncultured Aquincola sp.]|uniref:NAD(P)/FAD-dependent oxidoreductase n=1 Tax=uncultured Aquincola sp. TaxID=886556 RepID=UPI0032B230FE